MLDFSVTSFVRFVGYCKRRGTFVWEFLLPYLVTPQIVSSFLFHVALLLRLPLFLTLSYLYSDICINYLFQSSNVYTFTYHSSLRLFIWELLRRTFKFWRKPSNTRLTLKTSLMDTWHQSLSLTFPKSDQERIFPYNISAISRREVMKIK